MQDDQDSNFCVNIYYINFPLEKFLRKEKIECKTLKIFY